MLEQTRRAVYDGQSGAFNDELRLKIYQTVCRPGQEKSIAVYLLTVVLLVILGCVCCFENQKHLDALRSVVEMQEQKNKVTQI